jgi:hypothetical protein
MNDILKLVVMLIAISCVAVTASIVLPAPDGGVFAYTILLSAIVVTLIICSALSEGRISSVGEIMRAIEERRPVRLTLAAYLLGCSMVACVTVLLYRFAGRL